MIDFSTLKGLTIPEGVVTQITDARGRILWKLESSIPAVLQVEKITSDTRANETTYTGEQFVLFNIYPKTNGTVKVTYDGLTKTITDKSGVEKPNAQKVFFGTFNGVTDSVATSASGTLTIEGDYYAFGIGTYEVEGSTSSKTTTKYCSCITAVDDLGSPTEIPTYAFYECSLLNYIVIPESVTSIGSSAFGYCDSLTSVTIPDSVKSIGYYAFNSCTGLTSITIGSGVTIIRNDAFNHCKQLNIIVNNENNYYSSENGALFNKDKTTIIAYPSASGTYTIPSTVTKIGEYAFYESISSLKVIVPVSVTNIGAYAFYMSHGGARNTVVMLSTIPPTLGIYVFHTGTIVTGEFHNTIIVPKGYGDTYKTAEGWSDYADLIVEASE